MNTPALFDPDGNPTADAVAQSSRSARWRQAAPHAGADPIAVAFLDFHDRNPDVYAHLVTLCRQARSRGVERLGIKMLWEVLRWERSLVAGLPDPRESFKLPNSYTSRYARLIMALEPDLAGIFETTPLHSERLPG